MPMFLKGREPGNFLVHKLGYLRSPKPVLGPGTSPERRCVQLSVRKSDPGVGWQQVDICLQEKQTQLAKVLPQTEFSLEGPAPYSPGNSL